MRRMIAYNTSGDLFEIDGLGAIKRLSSAFDIHTSPGLNDELHGGR
jgi:hypothetical protein